MITRFSPENGSFMGMHNVGRIPPEEVVARKEVTGTWPASLDNGTEMAGRILALDWFRTSLGAITTWEQSLRSLVKTIVASRYPMLLTWGSELIQIYNDAYAKLIGDKHPEALGISVRITLAEGWDTLRPFVEGAIQSGVASWIPSLLLPLNRAGYREESYFSVSHAPAANDAGEVVGMLAVCSEVTQQVLGERRLRLLRDLSFGTGETRHVKTTCQDIVRAVSAHPLDVPFALVYLREPDGRSLALCGAIGLTIGTDAAPLSVDLSASADTYWPFARALSGETILIDRLEQTLDVRGGPWEDPVQSALVMPIASSDPATPLGVVIAGISPNRALDEGYRSFFDLLIGQMSIEVRNARAYEEERERAEVLAELDRAKTEFFSNVSHEFRTPLTLMIGPLEEALNDHEELLPAHQRDRIEIAHRNSLRLLRLVNTLLDFSRIEVGRAHATFEPTDLGPYTSELASVFRSAIERAGMRLVVDTETLPEPVYIDRSMWEKIVLNLLSNAFKFTFEGEIAVSLRQEENVVKLIVSDTGIGISENDLPRLFDRFYRVSEARGRSFEGSGIGLALVHELAKIHGGHVEVASTPGKGSTFTVSIPRGGEHPADDRIVISVPVARASSRASAFVAEALRWIPGPEPEPTPVSNGADLPAPDDVHVTVRPRASILLADDNADMRDYVCRLLTEHYDVRTVSNGAEALDAIHAERPDLVLTDVMMPVLDGFELLRRLRLDPQTRSIPIIMLSARAGEEAKVEGLRAGVDAYLIKPFSAQELKARVEATLQMVAARREEERRRSEETVRETASHLQFVLDAAQFGPFDLDLETMYVQRSLKHDQFFGYSSLVPEWNYAIFLQHVVPEDRERVDHEIRRTLSAGTDLELECRIRRVDGAIRWLWVKGSIYRDANGRPVRLLGLVTDITDRKQAEEERDRILHELELQQQRLAELNDTLEQRVAARTAQLEATNRELEAFSYSVSHDLRAPLRGITGFSRILEEEYTEKLDDDGRRYLERILAGAQKMGLLIDDLLTLARISRGDLERTDVDLSAMAVNIIEELRAKEPERNVAVVIETGMTASGDERLLNVALENLLGNAWKFTRKREEAHITFGSFEEDGKIVYFVRDNGAGFDMSFGDEIFAPFQRLHSPDEFEGTGVGLATVQRIVHRHGGTIRAESATDQGATFYFTLTPGIRSAS